MAGWITGIFVNYVTPVSMLLLAWWLTYMLNRDQMSRARLGKELSLPLTYTVAAPLIALIFVLRAIVSAQGAGFSTTLTRTYEEFGETFARPRRTAPPGIQSLLDIVCVVLTFGIYMWTVGQINNLFLNTVPGQTIAAPSNSGQLGQRPPQTVERVTITAVGETWACPLRHDRAQRPAWDDDRDWLVYQPARVFKPGDTIVDNLEVRNGRLYLRAGRAEALQVLINGQPETLAAIGVLDIDISSDGLRFGDGDRIPILCQ